MISDHVSIYLLTTTALPPSKRSERALSQRGGPACRLVPQHALLLQSFCFLHALRHCLAKLECESTQRASVRVSMRAACLFSVVLRSLLACLCLHVMGCDACEEGSSSSYLIVGESVLARGRRRSMARCDGCSRMPFVCLDLTYIFTITTMGGCLIDDASLVGKMRHYRLRSSTCVLCPR